MKRRLRLPVAMGILAALALPATADAAISSVSMGASVSPDPALAVSTPVSLSFS